MILLWESCWFPLKGSFKSKGYVLFCFFWVIKVTSVVDFMDSYLLHLCECVCVGVFFYWSVVFNC